MSRFALPLFLILFGFQSLAQSKVDRKIIHALKQDIGYLASDELEGRRTGSEGERKAAEYIICQYQKLEIPGYENNYRHPFKFVRGREIGNTSIELGGKIVTSVVGVYPLSFSANKKTDAAVLIDVQEQGAIWTISLYDSSDDAGNPHFDAEKAAWEKARDAEKNGATGVLIYDAYGSDYAPVFNPRSDFESLSIPVVFIGNQEWKRISAGDANSVNVKLDIQIVRPERQAANVAAFIDNHKPLTVVLGAHYDHLGHGEDGGSLYAGKTPMIHHGADDNASGTAALIRLAARIKKNKLDKYNYLFVHFSGEELGLLGSKAFVKSSGIDSNKIAYMINMDMLGRFSDSSKALMVGGYGTSPSWVKAKARLERDGFFIKTDSSGIGPSDHTSFYESNIPVLFFFTGVHSDYHKPGDVAEKINYTGEAKIIRGIEHVVCMMDNEPRPEFTKTKVSNVAKVRFKVTLGIMPDYSWDGEGVRVDGVIGGRPAEKAGIQTGDIILRLGSDEVKGMQTYMIALSHQVDGGKTTISVRRGGEIVELPIEFK